MASRPELIYCGRGNKRLDGIAVELGFLYGVRLPHTVHFPLYFADQEWKAPDRRRYMDALSRHRPAWATVLDLECPEQLEEALDWAWEASEIVSQGVVVIPKYSGAVEQIPEFLGTVPVRLGYSVPTGYGAADIPLRELAGRPVHLLGGQPHEQWYLAHQLNVVSLDCNYTTRKAIEFGEFYTGGLGYRRKKWQSLKSIGVAAREDSYLAAFAYSCMNILRLWDQEIGDPTPIEYGII